MRNLESVAHGANMAVETDEVQETQEATQVAAENSTPQEQETPAAEKTVTETPVAEAPKEETPAATPIPAWDTERQRRDEERAAREKERIEKLVQQRIDEELSKRGLAAQEKRDADELAQAEALEEEARQLKVEFRKAFQSADFDAAAAKDEEYDKKIAEAQKLRSSHTRRQAAILKQREVEAANRAAVSAEWQQFQAANPTVDITKAQELADECYRLAAEAGYEGPALRKRADEFFQAKLPSLKKSSTPAPKPTQQPAKQTVTTTGASTPPGTRVIPSNAGVRPSPNQTGAAAKTLGSILKAGIGIG